MTRITLLWAAAALLGFAAGRAQALPKPPADAQPMPASILGPNVAPIDLASALRLAGVNNAEIMLARERVLEAVAVHQLAAVQILPTLNAGTNLDLHTGNLQQS